MSWQDENWSQVAWQDGLCGVTVARLGSNHRQVKDSGRGEPNQKVMERELSLALRGFWSPRPPAMGARGRRGRFSVVLPFRPRNTPFLPRFRFAVAPSSARRFAFGEALRSAAGSEGERTRFTPRTRSLSSFHSVFLFRCLRLPGLLTGAAGRCAHLDLGSSPTEFSAVEAVLNRDPFRPRFGPFVIRSVFRAIAFACLAPLARRLGERIALSETAPPSFHRPGPAKSSTAVPPSAKVASPVKGDHRRMYPDSDLIGPVRPRECSVSVVVIVLFAGRIGSAYYSVRS